MRRSEYPGVEVFFKREKDQTKDTCFWNHEEDEPLGTGWFYWNCQPGCLPDSDPFGPFGSAKAAWQDAIETFDLGDGEDVDDEGEPVDREDKPQPFFDGDPSEMIGT